MEIARVILARDWAVYSACDIMCDDVTDKLYIFKEGIWIYTEEEYLKNLVFSIHTSNLLQEDDRMSKFLLTQLDESGYVNFIWKIIKTKISRTSSFQIFHKDNIPTNNWESFNTFQGFKATIAEGDNRLAKILWHINVDWAGNNQIIYNYIISWLAYPLRELKFPSTILVLNNLDSKVITMMKQFIYGPNCNGFIVGGEC